MRPGLFECYRFSGASMTPFVEASRQLVLGPLWLFGDSFVTHNDRKLVWRHHGLGMLQAEISETLRIHIWHPKLVSPGMVWPRCVHDHRFDITSAVVAGAITDVPCDVYLDGHMTPIERGWENVNVYEIEHAKNQDRMVLGSGCSTATSARLLSRGSLRPCPSWSLDDPNLKEAGTEYKIARRNFHTTQCSDLAITVVHRSNFDDHLARVLCAPNSDVTAISGIIRDESVEHRVLVNWVLREASDAIANLGADAPSKT